MRYLKFLLVLSFIFSACQNVAEKDSSFIATLEEIPTPCKEGGEPYLFASETGQIYLSWVEYLNDTMDMLVFSILENNQWTAPQTIASGSDWFVNWADFPSIIAYKDKGESLAAHWLQKSAAGTFDYDIHITQSFDKGKTWMPSFIPYQDSIPSEHGFVSMLPLSQNRIFLTWLDGRNTKGEGHGEKEPGHHGAMTLRAAIFDKAGKLQKETELDNRVCDCCQTSAALTDLGPIVVYRDRSLDEVRDIAITRHVNGKWTSPSLVFKDNWHIAGCPVNGPSIAAQGSSVVIAWFSIPNGDPQVKIVFSSDSGETFSPPIRVDNGTPLGRVDVTLLSNKEALVSWLEKTKDEAAIKAVKVDKNGKTSNDFLVATSHASRQSGFPLMAKTNNQIVFAWTEVDSLTRIKTAISNINK